MIYVAAFPENGDSEDVYAAFAASRAYTDALRSSRNDKTIRQSLAGLRALLFLLRLRGEDASSLVLERAEGGKPRFVSGPQFNISHSGGLAVCALSDSPVGVDIERLRPMRDPIALADRFFAPAEKAAIRASEAPSEAFLEVWVRKEAFLKLSGRGIDGRLDEIDTTATDIPVFALGHDGERYVAAVAGEGVTMAAGNIPWSPVQRSKR